MARGFRYFLSLVILFHGQVVSAQFTSFFAGDENATPRTFYGGIAIGANFSQVDGDGFSGYHKVGLNVGPQVYARIGSLFGASMEILYTQKGSKFREFQESSSGVPFQNMYDLKLNYVEVPILLHYTNRRLNYGLGASYARLISSKEEAYANYQVNLHPEIYTFHKDEISGLAEVGIEFYKAYFAQLRYEYSLTSIRDGDRIPEGYGGGKFGGQFNNLFSIRVLYMIK